MPTDFAFRLSTYLTLFLSCAALGYAEWDLLPEAAVFAFIVAGLLGVAFHQEGKLELSLKAANSLGIVIGIVALVWLVFQMIRPTGGLIYSLPWPASMLPYIGPLVMILMPAKLFRPKHIGDWWTMHGVGLAGIALGCAMADDLMFGLIAVAYLITGAWSLSLFFLRRAAGTITPIPGQEQFEPQAVVVSGEISTAPRTRLGRAFASRPIWALAAATIIGAILFFSTPRIDGPTWNLTRTREVGYNGGEESAPDLNRTGDLKGTNREIAFEVTVLNPDGSPKEDLSPNQRWRGRSFLEYQGGKWLSGSTMRVIYARGIKSGIRNPGNSPKNFPQAMKDEYSIDFRWLSRKRDAVVADPLTWVPGEPCPIVSIGQFGNFAWTQMPEGSFFPFTNEPVRQYRQIVIPPAENDMGSLFELMNWNPRLTDNRLNPLADPLFSYEVLTTTRLVTLKQYARDLLEKLIAENKLPKEILTRLDKATRNVAGQDHELVARAFTSYISESGEFQYSLKTPAVEGGLDPIEDFLTRSKVGSCERFATALVQLLRCLGIPCKMIIGFKGAEHQDGGKYYIRQEMAHAWVEVLVRRPTPPGYTSFDVVPLGVVSANDGKRSTSTSEDGTAELKAPTAGGRMEKLTPVPPPPFLYGWLSLDPTPDGNEIAITDLGLAGSMQSAWASLGEWFTSLVVNFDPDARRKLTALMTEWFFRWWPYVLISTLIVFGSLIVVRIAKRAAVLRQMIVRNTSSVPEWYQRYITVADKMDVPRAFHETPLEHARRFAARLPKEYDSWAMKVANLIAAVRYGETDADPQVVAEIEKGLTSLETK